MANHTDRRGVHHCGEVAEEHQWMFREQPVNDIGIDAYMELTQSTGEVKQLLALQIKTGLSYFKNKKNGYAILRNIKERQYKYWTTNSLPCIVVLYNPNSKMCIWQKLTTETIERTKGGKGKSFFVKVPLDQVFLDESSNQRLLSFSNLPEHITNYNFLLSQKQFMSIIKDGGTVKLHSTEWVNKSSGRGETELIVDDGNEEKTYSYPYWFPFTPYTEVLPKLFPWAHFSIDEEFYEEDDLTLWRNLHCYYDKEIDDWVVVGKSFKEFRKSLPAIRGVDHSGEVAEYMLILSLNDLGESFLTVDGYVSQIRPYAEARPEGD